MKIALFVNGPSDEKTISIFVHKILKKADIKTRVIPRGDLLNKEKVLVYIKFVLKEHSNVSKIIICLDSECERDVERTVKKIESDLKHRVKRPVHYTVVTHALEGWLLADPDAIRECLGPRVEVNIPYQATLDCKPKEVIKDIFRKASKDFYALRDNPRIAEKIDIDKMAKNNMSFDRFRERVKDP